MSESQIDCQSPLHSNVSPPTFQQEFDNPINCTQLPQNNQSSDNQEEQHFRKVRVNEKDIVIFNCMISKEIKDVTPDFQINNTQIKVSNQMTKQTDNVIERAIVIDTATRRITFRDIYTLLPFCSCEQQQEKQEYMDNKINQILKKEKLIQEKLEISQKECLEQLEIISKQNREIEECKLQLLDNSHMWEQQEKKLLKLQYQLQELHLEKEPLEEQIQHLSIKNQDLQRQLQAATILNSSFEKKCDAQKMKFEGLIEQIQGEYEKERDIFMKEKEEILQQSQDKMTKIIDSYDSMLSKLSEENQIKDQIKLEEAAEKNSIQIKELESQLQEMTLNEMEHKKKIEEYEKQIEEMTKQMNLFSHLNSSLRKQLDFLLQRMEQSQAAHPNISPEKIDLISNLEQNKIETVMPEQKLEYPFVQSKSFKLPKPYKKRLFIPKQEDEIPSELLQNFAYRSKNQDAYKQKKIKKNTKTLPKMKEKSKSSRSNVQKSFTKGFRIFLNQLSTKQMEYSNMPIILSELELEKLRKTYSVIVETSILNDEFIHFLIKNQHFSSLFIFFLENKAKQWIISSYAKNQPEYLKSLEHYLSLLPSHKSTQLDKEGYEQQTKSIESSNINMSF